MISSLASSHPSLNAAFKIDFFFFKLSINAFDYNCHLDLIKLLRQEGELVKLRRARQKMSELFPLTEGKEHPLFILFIYLLVTCVVLFQQCNNTLHRASCHHPQSGNVIQSSANC